MVQKYREKIRPLVIHEWTMEEYDKMSRFEYVRILLIQFVYFNSIGTLCSKKFWKEVRDGIKELDTFPKTFVLRYHLHLVLMVGDNVI